MVKPLVEHPEYCKCVVNELIITEVPPQATLQRLKAEEYVQQKRELLALYRNQGKESPNTRPSTPSPEDSQSSAEGR